MTFIVAIIVTIITKNKIFYFFLSKLQKAPQDMTIETVQIEIIVECIKVAPQFKVNENGFSICEINVQARVTELEFTAKYTTFCHLLTKQLSISKNIYHMKRV